MRLRSLLPAALALLLAAAQPASAHSMLERSAPRGGSVVRTAPAQLTLWFSERIEPAFSSVAVETTAGEKLAAGAITVLGEGKGRVQVALPPLAPGKYKVVWSVVSVDTHRSAGEFTFEVRPE